MQVPMDESVLLHRSTTNYITVCKQTFQTVENSSVPTIKAETYKQGIKPARVSLSDFVESKRSRI